MIKLYINGVIADIDDDTIITLSKQIINWQKLDNKNANYSNSINLPTSILNNSIFENANDIFRYNISRDWYNVNLVQNGYTIILNGKGKLISCENEIYKFAIYWGNIDLQSILADKKITELDLSNLNHTWDADNVARKYIVENELAYPIINYFRNDDYGTMQEGTIGDKISPERLIPFVNCNRILQQIATDNDVIFEGDIYNENNHWIPINKNYYAKEYGLEINAKNLLIPSQYGYLLLWYSLPIYGLIGDNSWKYNLITLNRGWTTVKNEKNIPISKSQIYQNITNTAITVKVTFNPKIQVAFNCINIENIIQGGEITMTAGLRKDNQTGLIVSKVARHSNIRELGWTDFEEQFESMTTYVTLQPNERIFIYYETFFRWKYADDDPLLTKPRTYTVSIKELPDTSITVDTELMAFDSTWFIANNLPDISQWEFLKCMCMKRGLVFENRIENIFTFKEIDNILTGKSVNLDNKLQEYEVSNMHTELSQNNVLSYKNDSTLAPEYAEYKFIINDNTLSIRDVFYQSIFSASEELLWRDMSICRIPIYEGSDKWFDLFPRIVAFSTTNFEVYINTATVLHEKYVAIFTPLKWGYIWLLHYLQYESILQDYIEINALMKLSEEDFHSIKLLEPIYIKQLGGKYLIEKIDKFQEGEMTNIKLIKIRE